MTRTDRRTEFHRIETLCEARSTYVFAAGFLLAIGACAGQTPPKPQEGPGSLKPQRVRLHPAIELSADQLLRLRDLTERRDAPNGLRDEEIAIDNFESMGGPECTDISCFEEIEPTDGPFTRRSPNLSRPVWELDIGVIDPQIAVSATDVVIGTGSWIRVFDRDGTLQLKTRVRDFFKPLWDPANSNNINASLNLPDGVQCDAFGTDPGPSTAFCLDTWYDVKLIYDEYRDRFWIVALARNENSRDGEFDNTGQKHTMAAEIAARRSKVVLAVSKTSDFFDGFYMYWWNGVIDDGACNDPSVEICPASWYMPGESADYPAIGVSKHAFVQTNAVGWRDPRQKLKSNSIRRYHHVTIWPADVLASGSGQWGWIYGFVDPEGNLPNHIEPALHHGRDPGAHYLANLYGNSVTVWQVETPLGTPPVLQQVQVPLVDPVNSARNGRQPDFPSGSDSRNLRLDNVRRVIMKAVYRDDRLHLAWPECRTWSSSHEYCTTSNRLVRMDVSNFPSIPTTTASGFRDRTFGAANVLDDAPDQLSAYGNPVVEVTADHTMVSVYTRVGESGVYPEARYSVWFDGDPDLLPSNVLHEGSYPYGSPGDAKARGQLDYGGISVDPFDDTTIWMAHGYTVQSQSGKERGVWRLAVGRLFGQTHPDLVIDEFKFKLQGKNRNIAEVRVTVRNQGDAPAGPAALHLLLSDDAQPSPDDDLLAQVTTPGGLPPANFFGHVLKNLGQAGSGPQYIIAYTDATHAVAEYSESNNVEARLTEERRTP